MGEVGGAAKREHHFTLTWQRDKIGAHGAVQYLSANAFNVLDTPETRDILGVDSHTLLHAGVNYRFNDRMQARLSITNLLDEDPPFPAYGTASVGMYDMLGRRFLMAFEWRQ